MTRLAQIAALVSVALVCAGWTGISARDLKRTADAPTLYIRLADALSTTKSKAGDSINAVSITALVVDGKTIATPGCRFPGEVLESFRPKGINERESVALAFSRFLDRDDVAHPVETTIIDVDNGRETVDADGRILGVAPVEKKPQNGADALKIAANGTQIMRALVSKVIGRVPPQIDYKAGAELILRVDRAPKVWSPIACGPVTPALQASDELSRIVNAQPFRTMTRAGDKASDVTNLVFIGSRDHLFAAFAAAGWVTAEAINATSSAKTFFATVAGEGYSEAPVSAQFIDGREPDAVFQKQLNTFAKRHHLRIWLRDDTFHGQPVWVAAATHDTGYVVSKDVKLFTHGIDPEIDKERSKIVNDLAFAGAVASHALVARPKAPREATTSIEETVRTDGRAAVIVLKQVAGPAGPKGPAS